MSYIYIDIRIQVVLIAKYHSGHQIKKNEVGGACSTYGEGRGAYRILVGRPEGRRSLGRPRRRWEDNIKMDLQEAGLGGMDWIDIAQDIDKWLDCYECGNEPSGSIKCGEFLD
jgi:hypothetical protein